MDLDASQKVTMYGEFSPIFYALICINNHVLSCLISMLSKGTKKFIFIARERRKTSEKEIVMVKGG